MKKLLHWIVILVMLAIVFLPAGAYAGGEPSRIDFSGSEWCDPDSLTVKREWGNEHEYHARGGRQTCYDTANIPQMTGVVTVTFKSLDITNDGATWEMKVTYVFKTDEGGVWKGKCEMIAGNDYIECHARGFGKYRGLYLTNRMTVPGGVFNGYISDQPIP